MERDPRFPRSREANWEGISIWAPFLAIFLFIVSRSRRYFYWPSWWPDYWSLQAAAFLSVLIIVTLKLHLTRHRRTLVLVAAALPLLTYLITVPYVLRDRSFARLVAEQPEESHRSGPLLYEPRPWGGTAYVHVAHWFE